MKILVFTDTHGSEKALKSVIKKAKKEKPDILICLGDFTIFGQYQKSILKQIDKMKIKTLLIHGNHEVVSEIKSDIKNMKNIQFLHKKAYRQDDVLFLGFGGGGFSLVEPKFKELIDVYKKIRKKGEKTILLTHGPPFGTELDMIWDQPCGCKTYTNFIRKYKPLYALSGHLHESNEKKQIYHKTILINPGPKGKMISV